MVLVSLVGLAFLGIAFLGFVLRRTFLGLPSLVWELIGLALMWFSSGYQWGTELRTLLLIGAVTLGAALFDPFIFRLHSEEARKEGPRKAWIMFGIINLMLGVVMFSAYLLGAWLA